MTYSKRTLAVQKHAAVSRALILLFFNTLGVSVIGFFVTSVNTGNNISVFMSHDAFSIYLTDKVQF